MSANSLYQQNIFHCFHAEIGPAGLNRNELGKALENVQDALERLRREHDLGRLPLLDVPSWRDDLVDMEQAAGLLAHDTSDIVLFGTGGSSLGAQALAQIADFLDTAPQREVHRRPKLHFFDNVETPWMERVLNRLPPDTTRFLVISKSGATPETLLQTFLAMNWLRQAGLEAEFNSRFLIVTQPKNKKSNPLREIANEHGLPVLDHPPDIGGRYAVLSIVGALPAMLLGLDPLNIRQGAQVILDPVLSGAQIMDIPPAVSAAVYVALVRRGQLKAVVTMPYTSRLRLFSAWFQQLWAESLGKGGQGTQPVTAIGPVDQHSQLQLFLDGPNDKLFTLIMPSSSGKGFRLPEALRSNADYGYLAGHHIGDFTDCLQRATAESLVRRGRPVRTIHIKHLDERTIGALFMHFMLETILTGYMLNVNPFDQPAVEFSKQITRELLAARAQ